MEVNNMGWPNKPETEKWECPKCGEYTDKSKHWCDKCKTEKGYSQKVVDKILGK